LTFEITFNIFFSLLLLSVGDLLTIKYFIREALFLSTEIVSFIDKTVSDCKFGFSDYFTTYENGVAIRPLYGTDLGKGQDKNPALEVIPAGSRVIFGIVPYGEIMIPIYRKMLIYTNDSHPREFAPFSKAIL
jgi:hypothetical protein